MNLLIWFGLIMSTLLMPVLSGVLESLAIDEQKPEPNPPSHLHATDQTQNTAKRKSSPLSTTVPHHPSDQQRPLPSFSFQMPKARVVNSASLEGAQGANQAPQLKGAPHGLQGVHPTQDAQASRHVSSQQENQATAGHQVPQTFHQLQASQRLHVSQKVEASQGLQPTERHSGFNDPGTSQRLQATGGKRSAQSDRASPDNEDAIGKSWKEAQAGKLAQYVAILPGRFDHQRQVSKEVLSTKPLTKEVLTAHLRSQSPESAASRYRQLFFSQSGSSSSSFKSAGSTDVRSDPFMSTHSHLWHPSLEPKSSSLSNPRPVKPPRYREVPRIQEDILTRLVSRDRFISRRPDLQRNPSTTSQDGSAGSLSSRAWSSEALWSPKSSDSLHSITPSSEGGVRQRPFLPTFRPRAPQHSPIIETLESEASSSSSANPTHRKPQPPSHSEGKESLGTVLPMAPSFHPPGASVQPGLLAPSERQAQSRFVRPLQNAPYRPPGARRNLMSDLKFNEIRDPGPPSQPGTSKTRAQMVPFDVDFLDSPTRRSFQESTLKKMPSRLVNEKNKDWRWDTL